MKIGTKSILYGAHAFWIHPIIVAIAWIKLYGFPFSIPIWTSFFVHDLGYWGKPNMDGEEGEKHVELGANIMSWLFDDKGEIISKGKHHTTRYYKQLDKYLYWYRFTLYHSRFYAKKHNASISKLCVADKAAFYTLPKWFYLLLVSLSGEVNEYMTKGRSSTVWTSKSDWYDHTCEHMTNWVKEHKDNLNDSWTVIPPKSEIAEQTKCSYD